VRCSAAVSGHEPATPWGRHATDARYAGPIVESWRDNRYTRDDVAWLGTIARVLVNRPNGVPHVACNLSAG